MNCMNCAENMVAKRKDKRYANTASSNVLRPLRPPANHSGWEASSAASSCGAVKKTIIVKDMPFYCFEVLLSHIYRLEAPRVPSFTNDP